MSPVEIKVLLNCYYLREALPDFNAPAVREALSKFLRVGQIKLREGLLEPGDNPYTVTKSGRETVNRLCNVKMARI